MPDTIDVKGLCKSFAGREVVKNVTLKVKQGEVFGFLGPNGSGKTTTIRMLCGLLTPDAGFGTCLGYDIRTEFYQIKRQVGYMTQKFSFYTDLTVRENLSFIARVYDLDNLTSRVNAIMDKMGLKARQDQLVGELSGGWKQRLALSACLVHEPKLLLLDEPTAGVDPVARREFWDNIHELSEQGITTLVSTHYMDEAERCTRLAYLASGQLLVTGTVKEVIKKVDLKTWRVSGDVTTELLQKIKALPGVFQATLYGQQIHVGGMDVALIESGLGLLSQAVIEKKGRVQAEVNRPIQWERIDPTLEDAFITFVQQDRQ